MGAAPHHKNTMAARRELTAGVGAAALLGGLTAILAALLWGGFWAGLTLSLLWGWFVTPLFALPAITVWQAYGLVLVARTLAPKAESKAEDKPFGELLAKAALMPPVGASFVLLFGWCVKHWV